MNDHPRISIITPVYNASAYLSDTISSVLKQSFTDYEWIVCDDGSTDASYQMLLEQESAFNGRLKLLTQENQGVSSARNSCLAASEGDYLMFLDADDCLHDDALSVLCSQMDSSNADVGIYGWYIHQSGDLFSYQFEEKETGADNEGIYEMILKDPYLCGGGYPWNKIWRRSAVSFPLFREDLHHFEDKLWTLQCFDLLRNPRVYFIDQPLYHYYIRDTSLSHNMTEEGFLQLAEYTLDSLEAMRNYIEMVHPQALDAMNELTREKLATIRSVLGDI